MSMRALSRRLLVWLYGATSLLGFLAEPTQANVSAVAGYVVVVTGLTAFLHWVFTEHTMCADRLIAVALTAAGLPMALTAIFTVLGPAGLAVGLVLLALAAMAMIDVAAYLTTPFSQAGTDPDTPAEAERTPQRPPLTAMSTSALIRLWRTCGSGLHAVQLRSDILDELERRDPVGVDLWIRDGIAASPADYVRDDGLNA